MRNDDIEDIFIGNNSEVKTKKGRKGVFIVIFIILILMLVGVSGAYFYFSNQTLTKKQIFINGLTNTNIKKFLENNIYEEFSNRVLNENSETETKIQFSTTEKTEELEGVDIRNFELNLKNQNDVKNSKNFGELLVNYSGNEIFKASFLAGKDAFALDSEELVDRYVGIRYDKMEEVFGIEFDKGQIENLENQSKIELSETEKNDYVKKFGAKFFENVAEEKFSSQENIVINKNNTSIDVVSYTMKLNQEEYKTALTTMINEIKNDTEFLNKVVTGENTSEELQKEESESEISNTVNLENIDVQENQLEKGADINLESESNINLHDETNTNQTVTEPQEENFNSNIEIEGDSQEATQTENGAQEENSNDISEANIDVTSLESDNIENSTKTTQEDVTEVLEGKEDYSELMKLLIPITLGNKLEMSTEELQEQLDTVLDNISKTEGNGISVTIYVSQTATEKISVIMPKGETLDIEFTKDSADENNNTIQLTYLHETIEEPVVGDSEVIQEKNETNEVETFSAEDDITKTTTSGDSNQKDGFKLKINKVAKEASNSIKINLDIIEKEQINQKFSLEVKTNGTKTAKNISSEIIFKINTDEDEFKVVADNKINFADEFQIDELTDENCLFLDSLSPEERAATVESILERILVVYTEKIEGLAVIDTNTNNPIVNTDINDVANKITREEAKQVLIDRVSLMMGEAQNNGEEFTIQNLVDLKIDGYEVSSNVNEEAAIIVVDTYTFKIDTSFTLTDVEE